MKSLSLVLLSVCCATPLLADQDQRIIPAGSLISCTISEPKISSRTTAIGDPVLCQLSHSEHYGRSVLPYKSYLVGRFEDYKDPGHFVGKGWMQLKFDRMVVEPDTVIPVDARVVDVPGYRVDNQGRILGKGHATRDAVLWSIPVLWPVDLVMLPMRGPRPTLKEETHLTLKVMDDLAVPATDQPQPDSYGLQHRQPSAENEPPPPPPGLDQQPDQQPGQLAQQSAPDPSYLSQPDAQPQYPPQGNAPADQIAPPPPVYAYTPVAPPYPPTYAPPIYAYGFPAYGYGAYGGYRASRGFQPAYRGYGFAGRSNWYAPHPGGYPPRNAGNGPRPGGYAPRPGGYGPRNPGYGSAPRAFASGGTRGGMGYGGGGSRASMGARGGGGFGGSRR